MNIYSPVTLGKSLKKLEKRGLVLTETKHQPKLSLARHGHKNASIACILEGSYEENIDNRSYACTPNSLLVKPAGEYHSNKYHRGGAHCLLIEIKPERLDEFSPLTNLLNIQGRVNRFGYIMTFYRKPDLAIGFFELNTELFPNSANTWDSLAEAYMSKGNRDLAIK